MEFIQWLEALPLSEWVATSEWGYPLLLSVHSMGMAVVVGLLLVLDARVLGFAPRIPFEGLARFMPFAWAGFALNLASGVVLFMSTAGRLITNWPFIAKMAAIVLAGLISAALWQALRADWAEAGEPVVTPKARGLAMASIGAWLVAIVCGRLIAYVMDAAILAGS